MQLDWIRELEAKKRRASSKQQAQPFQLPIYQIRRFEKDCVNIKKRIHISKTTVTGPHSIC
jgi:hypothetical protein